MCAFAGVYDEATSTFFRNVDSRYEDPPDIPVGSGRGSIRALRARAVLVDMEEGVISQVVDGGGAAAAPGGGRCCACTGACAGVQFQDRRAV